MSEKKSVCHPERRGLRAAERRYTKMEVMAESLSGKLASLVLPGAGGGRSASAPSGRQIRR